MSQTTCLPMVCGQCGRPIGGLQTWLAGQAYHPECTHGPDYKQEPFTPLVDPNLRRELDDLKRRVHELERR